MPNHPHAAWDAENAHLSRTLSVIEAEKTRAAEELKDAEAQLKEARAYDPDKLPIREILYVKAFETERGMTVALGKPYFTRIDFTEDGGSKSTYYIGKYGVIDSDTLESVVVDWRAPLANLYYSGQLGRVEYVAPDGKVAGDLTLKRQFDISDGKLNSIFDTDIVSQDAYLQNALNQMNGERLKEIVTTIQAEQNYVIRYPLRQSLVVQGVAGSGKTTIALHRIAYLLYAFRDQLRPENMLILAPNPLFLNYIAGVLPDLGVERVNQTTFPMLLSDWLGRMLGKIDFSDRTETVLNLPADERKALTRIARLKGSVKLQTALDAFFSSWESRFSPEDGIRFGPVSLWTKEEMDRFLFVDEAPFPMARRVSEFKKQLLLRAKAAAKRLEAWFLSESDRRAELIRKEHESKPDLVAHLNRLYESRDARIRQTREQVKPFADEVIASLPSMEPISLYRDFWESVEDDYGFSEAARRTIARIDAKMPLEPEDAAPIAYLAMKLHELPRHEIRHVVIDEAQDFSAFEYMLLTRMMPSATFTVVGDLMQGIHSWRGLQSWDEITQSVFRGACSTHSLITSYRSTVEVMETALRVAKHRPTPGQTEVRSVIRHGEKTEFRAFTGEAEQASLIADTIARWQEAGMRVIAVIERRRETVARLVKRLPAQLNARVLDTEDTEYTGGVYVSPASAVKGLEFDGVIIADASENLYPDADLDARLLYVALTRPLHRLCVLYSGTITPLLAEDKCQ